MAPSKASSSDLSTPKSSTSTFLTTKHLEIIESGAFGFVDKFELPEHWKSKFEEIEKLKKEGEKLEKDLERIRKQDEEMDKKIEEDKKRFEKDEQYL